MGQRNPNFVGRGHKGRSFPPEQRARVSEGLRLWHACMTDDERETYAQKQCDAHLPGMWTPNRHRVVTPFVKGHSDMSTPEGIRAMQDGKLARPSIKRHMVDIARDQPELIRDAILRELAGPRAPAMLLMFAAYLDGKPGENNVAPEPQPWVQWLTEEELEFVGKLIAVAQARMEAGERSREEQVTAQRAQREREQLEAEIIDVDADSVVLE
jgi:hypothetical protein